MANTHVPTGVPALIARRNKRYCVTVDMSSLTPDEGGRFPLPRELRKPGDGASFSIWVGDDIEQARRDGVLDDMWLRVTYAGHDQGRERAALSLNGRKLPAGRPVDARDRTTVTYDDVPAVQGPNEIAVALDRAGKDAEIGAPESLGCVRNNQWVP